MVHYYSILRKLTNWLKTSFLAFFTFIFLPENPEEGPDKLLISIFGEFFSRCCYIVDCQ